MQGIPAGFPLDIPGIGEEIEITIQHAPQPTLQSTIYLPPTHYRLIIPSGVIKNVVTLIDLGNHTIGIFATIS